MQTGMEYQSRHPSPAPSPALYAISPRCAIPACRRTRAAATAPGKSRSLKPSDDFLAGDAEAGSFEQRKYPRRGSARQTDALIDETGQRISFVRRVWTVMVERLRGWSRPAWRVRCPASERQWLLEILTAQFTHRAGRAEVRAVERSGRLTRMAGAFAGAVV